MTHFNPGVAEKVRNRIMSPAYWHTRFSASHPPAADVLLHDEELAISGTLRRKGSMRDIGCGPFGAILGSGYSVEADQ